jgi:CHAD domain-containing protein
MVLDASPGDEAVHRARTSIKKARAALRLLRPALGRRRFRHENAALRRAAHALTPWRDATVLLRTLDELSTSTEFGQEPDQIDSLRQLLLRQQGTARGQLQRPKALAELRSTLNHARRRASRRSAGQGWSILGPALRRSYRRGQSAFELAHRSPTDEHLHTWRKQTKTLLYQLRMLRPMAPRRLEVKTHALQTQAQQLGRDRDLALLRQLAIHASGRISNPRTHDALIGHIDRERRDLQRRAYARGRVFYRASPRLFLARLTPCWRAWRR